MKVYVANTTLVCIDCRQVGGAIAALRNSMNECDFDKVLLLTDKNIKLEGIDVVLIPTISSVREYSDFVIRELYKYIKTEYMLIVQADGYVLNGKMWSEDFREYDYIGAPWLEKDGYNVGNGGFSFRSKKLMEFASGVITVTHPEDVSICRTYRPFLEEIHDIKFAPDDVADRFAFELREPASETFGFHGSFHQPYKKTIVLHRKGALGDIVQMEPLISELIENDYRVVLDIPLHYYDVFRAMSVDHISVFDKSRIKHKYIDLDMAYEGRPELTHIEAYFAAVFGDNYIIQNKRNQKLLPEMTENSRLFTNTCVLHIDDTRNNERNVWGVNWQELVSHLNDMGYDCVEVGHTPKKVKGSVHVNTLNTGMLQYVISSARLFIGVDSGPAHIAVGHGVPSLVLFGNVNPKKIFYDAPHLRTLIGKKCPIEKDFCWHNTIGETGTTCEVDHSLPPCTEHSTSAIKTALLGLKIANQL